MQELQTDLCEMRWRVNMQALTVCLFFYLQYYEMSYGLNIEMHKQVSAILNEFMSRSRSGCEMNSYLFLC